MDIIFTETADKGEKQVCMAISLHHDGELENPEANPSDVEGANSFYVRSNKSPIDIRDLCKEYPAYNREFTKKANEDPKNESKLRICRYGIGPHHKVCFGSLHYCPYFLEMSDINSRKQLMRTRSLRTDHSSVSCKSRNPQC